MDRNCFYWDDFIYRGEHRYVCKSSGHIEEIVIRVGSKDNPLYKTKSCGDFISLESAKKAVEEAINKYYDGLIEKK